MPITVQEIVNLPIFNSAKVKSGIELLDNRQVEWMSAIEGPVENFVRKYEFVLTTGLGCESDPASLFEFTKDVYESGASALGIAIGRYVRSEEHTSELQSRGHLVCRLLLEKKKLQRRHLSVALAACGSR